MTDKQMAKVLEDMVIICDTREQKNAHILSYFEDNGIKYIEKKLDSADYGVMLPNYPELDLDNCVVIERKNSWDEIIGNFTTNRERFAREFERMRETDIAHIVIEGATWGQLLKGSYRSKVNPQSVMASMLSWNVRYDCNFWFASTKESPIIIRNLIYYGLREHLKNIELPIDK